MDLRLHLPAALGALALLVAALLAMVLVPRWRAEQAQAEAFWLQQRQQHQARSAALPPAPPPLGQRLVQALPPADALPQRLAALVSLAQRHAVTLDSLRQSAPLRLGSGAAALAAEQVPLRLTGSAPYHAWRSFVAEALQHDDALLLDQLQLSRPSPATALLAADLQWLLLQRADLAGAATAPSTPVGRQAALP